MSGNGGGPVGTGAVRGLLSLYGTNSEYNKRKSSDNGLVDFASAKRVRSEYFPAGKFNDNGAGPTSVLADKGNDRESMVKNLATNQTEKTLYINIPRFIMPVLLSNGHTGTGNRNMALCKSVVAGDVVFHLRFNNHMIENNHATTVPSKSVIAAACFAVNLQTVNYILSHLHRQLAFFTDAMLGDDARSLGGNAWNHPYELDRTAFMAIIEARQRVLETDIDMKTWSIFFLNISRSSGSDAFSELFKRVAAASAQSFFGKWFAKMRQRQNDTGAVVAPSERKLMLEKYLSRLVWQFLRTYIKIAGIFIGSDYQGGNDQGDPNPCSFLSTDYTSTIQVTGKSLKVKNKWSSQAPGVRGGNVLGFRLVHSASPDDNLDFHLSSNPAVPKLATLKDTVPILAHTIHPLLLMPCVMGRRAHVGAAANPGYSVYTHTPYFIQLGVSNQISNR